MGDALQSGDVAGQRAACCRCQRDADRRERGCAIEGNLASFGPIGIWVFRTVYRGDQLGTAPAGGDIMGERCGPLSDCRDALRDADPGTAR
jgi:hypothetical protein